MYWTRYLTRQEKAARKRQMSHIFADPKKVNKPWRKIARKRRKAKRKARK